MAMLPMPMGPGGPHGPFTCYPPLTSTYGDFPVLEVGGLLPPPLDHLYYIPPVCAPGFFPAPIEPVQPPAERYGGLLLPPPPPQTPLTVMLTSADRACSPPSPPPRQTMAVTTMPSCLMTPPPTMPSCLLTPPSSMPSCLLTPPSTPEPVVWVRPRLAPAPVADPRTLAEVHSPGCVQQWTKGLRLDDALVAVHVRHEGYTVEPAFPGPVPRHLVTDPAGVMHVCVPVSSFKSQVDYGMYVVWVTAFAELFNRTGQHWALVPQPPSTPKPSHIWRCFSTSAKIRFRCDTCQNAWTSMHGQVTFQYFLHKGPGAGTVLFQLYGQKCRVCVRQRQRDRARAAAAEGAGVAAPPTPPPEAEGATAAGPAGPVGGPAGAVAGPAGAVAGPAGAVAGPAGAVGGPAGVEGAAAPAPADEEDDVPYSNPMWYPDEVRRVLMELYCQVSSKLYPHLPRPQPPAGHQRRFGRPQQAHDPALCQGCAAGTCRMVRR